ncbi:MAG: GntR family transcriptional regulator [Oscillospiraceae bacterium]|nr:GntR family transcriptional regulator [Oscillospiraceae bacterium]
MFTIDLQSRKPISEQIYDNLRDQIISGVIASDAKIPSVREISERLSVSPNTTMKAYKLLEDRGYVYSSAGLGTFAAPREKWLDGNRLMTNAVELLRRAVIELTHGGADKEQVIRLASEIYEEVTKV